MRQIPLFKTTIAPETGDLVKDTLYSGYLTQGPKVSLFEDKLKDYYKTKYLFTVNSATSGLQLAYNLANIRPGDLCLVPSLSCIATVTALLAVGGIPVWIDVDTKTGNISLDSVDQLLQEYRTIKALACVHWGGYPCDLQILYDLANFHGIPVIEDAAHAFGSTYFDRPIGSTGADFVVHSYQAIKHLTTGDGGSVICNNERDHEEGKLLRWYGIDRESPDEDQRTSYNVQQAGWKFHMNDLTASVGLGNLELAKQNVLKHRENGKYFDEALRDIRGIKLLERRPGYESSFWIYTLLADNRSDFVSYLGKAGIHTSQVHSRLDRHETFRHSYNKENLPGLDYFSRHQVSIPVGWWVTNEDREYITNTIKEWASGN